MSGRKPDKNRRPVDYAVLAYSGINIYACFGFSVKVFLIIVTFF